MTQKPPNPIRVATAAISGRIFAGRPTKDGRGFKEPRYDVTGDVLRAIRDKVGVGNEVEVGLPGTAVEFRIAILPPYAPAALPVDGEAIRRENEQLRAALRRMVYEATHLSPCKTNGDHDCTIKADALAQARAALPSFIDGGQG